MVSVMMTGAQTVSNFAGDVTVSDDADGRVASEYIAESDDWIRVPAD